MQGSFQLKVSRFFLQLLLLGGRVAAIIQDLSQNGAVEDSRDDVIGDCEQIPGLDPRRGDPNHASEEEKTDGDGRQLTRGRGAEISHDLQQLEK